MKVVEADFGDRWNKIQQQVRNDLGLSSGGVREKNSLLIAATLEKLASEGYQSQTLDRVCEILIRFAKGVAARTDDVSVEDVTALPGLIG